MSKVILIKIKKEEIDQMIKKAIEHKIKEVCKKQAIDSQIEFEVEQSVLEVNLPALEAKITELEFMVGEIYKKLEKK